MQILSLNVLNQRQQSGFLILRPDLETGNRVQPRQLCRPETALSRHQLPAGLCPADGQGLEDPVPTDGVRQLCQRFRGEVRPGLVGVGGDCLYRQPEYLCVQHSRIPPECADILPAFCPF